MLGARTQSYTYVDFCAGAGGPTPFIEAELNARLAADGADTGVDFVLTDIAPHLSAWAAAAKKSPHLHYVARSVDAANAPTDLLHGVATSDARPPFRLFSLAFHHFDDALGAQILRNTLDTSAGIAIFELTERTTASLLMNVLTFPVGLLTNWWTFRRDAIMLACTYLLPVVPFVVSFDGLVSSLRTRTPDEVMRLLKTAGQGAEQEWEWTSGRVTHTWPIGQMTYVIGTRK